MVGWTYGCRVLPRRQIQSQDPSRLERHAWLIELVRRRLIREKRHEEDVSSSKGLESRQDQANSRRTKSFSRGARAGLGFQVGPEQIRATV